MVSGFLAFIFSIFGAFVIEFISKLKTEQGSIHFVEEIKTDIKLLSNRLQEHVFSRLKK